MGRHRGVLVHLLLAREQATTAAPAPAQAVRDALQAIRTAMVDCPLDEVLDAITADLPDAVTAHLHHPK